MSEPVYSERVQEEIERLRERLVDDLAKVPRIGEQTISDLVGVAPLSPTRLSVDEFIEYLGGPEFWPPEIPVGFCRGVTIEPGALEPDPDDREALLCPVRYIFDLRYFVATVRIR